MATMSIYDEKHLKIYFLRTKKDSRLNLVTEHWGLKVIQVFSNNDPRLTFDLFMTVKFMSVCIYMGKILKIQFLEMY